MGLDKDCKIDLKPLFERGERNLISDVEGVTVGHTTLISEDGQVNTGVTVVMPHQGNIFREKLLCGTSVINGFGKSAGLIQIRELGTLESPIFMTNTLSVGTVLTAGVKYSLENNPEIGVSTGTVNCLVTECSDAPLNDIRGLHVTEDDVFKAIENARADFEEGVVGAGTGMVMMSHKGGIGSSSRKVKIGDKTYTTGALVMSNYGNVRNLTIGGDPVGRRLVKKNEPDKGSCILIVATDAPLSSRQLDRVANRAAHALARTGSYSGNGSGDVAIAFSTANRVEHFPSAVSKSFEFLYDEYIDALFAASVEAMEEALISSLVHGHTVKGVRGRVVEGFKYE